MALPLFWSIKRNWNDFVGRIPLFFITEYNQKVYCTHQTIADRSNVDDFYFFYLFSFFAWRIEELISADDFHYSDHERRLSGYFNFSGWEIREREGTFYLPRKERKSLISGLRLDDSICRKDNRISCKKSFLSSFWQIGNWIFFFFDNFYRIVTAFLIIIRFSIYFICLLHFVTKQTALHFIEQFVKY